MYFNSISRRMYAELKRKHNVAPYAFLHTQISISFFFRCCCLLQMSLMETVNDSNENDLTNFQYEQARRTVHSIEMYKIENLNRAKSYEHKGIEINIYTCV